MKTTIETLATALEGKLWIKGDMKRIYLDRGYNTKKMSTKTYIYEQNGEFKVSCYIECSSQPFAWIKSQQEEVISGVENDINEAIDKIENPEKYTKLNYMPYSLRVKTVCASKIEVSESVITSKGEIKSLVSFDFESGKSYNHPKFGNGKLINEDENMITINFESVGEKKLIKKYVKSMLTPIS